LARAAAVCRVRAVVDVVTVVFLAADLRVRRFVDVVLELDVFLEVWAPASDGRLTPTTAARRQISRTVLNSLEV